MGWIGGGGTDRSTGVVDIGEISIAEMVYLEYTSYRYRAAMYPAEMV